MIARPPVRLFVVLLVLACTAGCDQTTKHFARSELNLHSAVLPGGFVELTLAENPGAFLSFGAALPAEVRDGVFAVGVALGLTFVLGYLMRSAKFRWLSFLALALVWAGGMSNLFDRFTRHGLVTDFIVLRAGPLHTGVFNLADLAIVSGIAVFFLSFAGRGKDSETKVAPLT